MSTKKGDSKYDANFTAGGLLLNEFMNLQDVIQDENILDILKSEEEENQYVGIDTVAARKRILSEIKRRIEFTDSEFWDLFGSVSEGYKKIMLFYLVLKTYPLIWELHFEVVYQKFLLGAALDAYSISLFLDSVASSDDYVGGWSDSTLDKLNTQYRKVLTDCGMLDKGVLRPVYGVTTEFWEYFQGLGEKWFKQACFN
jgi:hypothetical protein